MIKQLLIDYKATNVGDLETKLREAGSSLNTQRMVFIEQQMVFSWMKEQIKEEERPHARADAAFYQEHHADWETPAKAKWEQLSDAFASYSTKQEAWQALTRIGATRSCKRSIRRRGQRALARFCL